LEEMDREDGVQKRVKHLSTKLATFSLKLVAPQKGEGGAMYRQKCVQGVSKGGEQRGALERKKGGLGHNSKRNCCWNCVPVVCF